MKYEIISKRRMSVVLLDVRLNNLYAFKNFHLNLTYPKRIVGSSIPNEHLPERTNFRYKKVNIIFGANASGKTTFGHALMNAFNFIDKKVYAFVTEMISDRNQEASFALDLASQDNYLYRVTCAITPPVDGDYSAENVLVNVRKVKIGVNDSYENCVAKIDALDSSPAENYLEALENVDDLAWLFQHPNDEIVLPNKNEKFRFVLENVLKSLDPSIQEVKISQDVESAYVIHFRNRAIVIQSGQRLNNDFLSSGTKSGIAIAKVVFSLMRKRNHFYYCDEKFPYIHSDVEKALFSLMIDCLGPYDQLFFTTHNTDVLDMALPKHSFTFLRKDTENEDFPITCINAASLLKRNTDSLRSAFENDLFSVAPAVELIYDIANSYDEEVD